MKPNGFNCIKLKIGALDFNEEISILCEIRKHFDEKQIILRVDANGSFSPKEAMNKLKSLADLGIHSIEQPIAKGQYKEMKNLCLRSPIPIALDEELIGVTEKIEPGETKTLKKGSNVLQYLRLVHVGEEEGLTLVTIELGNIIEDDGEKTPALSPISVILSLISVAAVAGFVYWARSPKKELIDLSQTAIRKVQRKRK